MIDYKFISDLEGNSFIGYVPDPKYSNSGVTIASGFDLGSRSYRSLHKKFSKELADKLSMYVGMKKYEAKRFLECNPLNITRQEAQQINSGSHDDSELLLIKEWSKYSDEHFLNLSGECQTVIASVAFQYGNLARKAPNFWRQVTSGDWVGALGNLRNFGDRYRTRRNKEADLLESYIRK